MQDHLEQDVPEFLADPIGLAGAQRLHGLVSFFDHVRRQAVVSLLAIPRAAARAAQIVNHGAQSRQAVTVIGNGFGHGRA